MNTVVFVASLVITALLLLASVWTGVKGQRQKHIPLVVCTVASLAFAIMQARIYGDALTAEGYELPSDRLKIHLALAFSALGLLPVVAITGGTLMVKARVRPIHRVAAWTFVVVTLAAMGTAIWMLAGAELLGEPV